MGQFDSLPLTPWKPFTKPESCMILVNKFNTLGLEFPLNPIYDSKGLSLPAWEAGQQAAAHRIGDLIRSINCSPTGMGLLLGSHLSLLAAKLELGPDTLTNKFLDRRRCALTTNLTALAIRVVTAINNRATPDFKDVDLLRSYFPNQPDCDPYELACLAIQEAIVQKQAARDSRKYRIA
jgi:hypothetical protein